MRRCVICNRIVENHEVTCGECFIKKLNKDKEIIESIPDNIIN